MITFLGGAVTWFLALCGRVSLPVSVPTSDCIKVIGFIQSLVPTHSGVFV